MNDNVVTRKRACSESIEGNPPEPKKQCTIEEEVNRLCQLVMSEINPITHWTTSRRLFNLIKNQPSEPNIWNLVFEKLNIPLTSIPFDHGLSCSLPTVLWENGCRWLKILPSQNQDISKESLQDFITCLQRCTSSYTLTQENSKEIMKLSKRYQLMWLFAECLEFSLIHKLGDLGKAAYIKGVAYGRLFRFLEFEFNELSPFLSYLLLNCPEIAPHLAEVIPIFYPSETDNQEHSVYFGENLKVCLPMYLWKAYSNFAWEKVNHLEVGATHESLEAFTRCLSSCTSFRILTLENYSRLFELADKYQITWLIKDCEEFFKVHTLSQAASAGFFSIVNDYVDELIRKNAPLSLNAKEVLNTFADQYRLLTLKLFVNEFNLEFLPNKSLYVYMPELQEDRARLQNCLAMDNPRNAPEIELSCDNHSKDHFSVDDFNEISKIVETVKCPLTVRLHYIYNCEKTSNQLSENLLQNPLIKHLKIVISGNVSGFIDPILKMIEENTTLESLTLVVSEELADFPKEERVNKIGMAFDNNVHIKEVRLLHTNLCIDEVSLKPSDNDIFESYIKGSEDLANG